MQNNAIVENIKRRQQLLFNRVASSALSLENYRLNAASCLAEAKSRNAFRDIFAKLLNQPRFRSLLNAYPADKEKLSSMPVFRYDISIDRQFDLIALVLCRESDLLNSFVQARDGFEDAIVKSQYELAETILDSFADAHGISLWLIRSRVLLLSYQARNEEIHQLCAEAKEVANAELIKSLIDYFQLFSDSDPNNCLQLHDSLIHKHVTEFNEANLHEMASLLSIFFSPSSRGDSKLTSCIPTIQVFPLVDQYVIFSMIIQHLVIDEICTGSYNELDAHHQLRILTNVINDPQLLRARNFLSKSVESDPSALGKNILEFYEAGRYQDVLDMFENGYEHLSNPISYVNLVAKAYAYLGQTPKATGKDIVFDLLGKIVPIYTLDADHHRFEEDLWSRVIRLKGLTQSANIQTALFLAMPHRFNDDDIKRSSAFSVIASCECTPIIENILGGSGELFGNRYAGPYAESFPYYRRIKHSLCHAINEERPAEEIETLFQEFKESSPLFKDYLELYSDYCIFTKQFSRLLQVGAESLVGDQNTYACIPMEYLAKEIERQFTSTLHSVIVAFYYSRNVSPRINGLLNEIFEEYLSNCGVERPSELLSQVQSLSSMELVFYHEICIPDVMDYLSCFSDINELRAERIKILDILLQLNAVDNATRTQEVEELVGMSIVDAATTGINSGKIFVDIDALRKMLAQDVLSLFNSYKLTSADEEDRITVWREDASQNGTANAYMTGSKSSLILKLFNLHLEAFLFNEKYGLDKNLSTEIRHGFFENLMRAILQERFLITEIDDNGEYHSNDHWHSQYSIVSGDVWDDVDDTLKGFSAGFNEIIGSAEEWMKIRVSREQSDRLFVYELPIEEFQCVQSKCEEAENAEEVSLFIFDMLLKTTDRYLLTIREKLHSEFQVALDALFNKLIEEITIAKRGAAFAELMNVIRQTQSDIKERVITASEWFRSAAQLKMDQLPLDRVIEIATTTFKNINGTRGDMAIRLPSGLKNVYMPGSSVKPFTIAMNNLLDNCYRRSGLGQSVKVEVCGEVTQNGADITIQNNVSLDVMNALSQSRVAEISKPLVAPKCSRLMRTEGSSGLVKAANLIAFASEESTLHIEASDCIFKARISYVT